MKLFSASRTRYLVDFEVKRWEVNLHVPAVHRDRSVLAELLLCFVHLADEVDETLSWFGHALLGPVGELELPHRPGLTVLQHNTLFFFTKALIPELFSTWSTKWVYANLSVNPLCLIYTRVKRVSPNRPDFLHFTRFLVNGIELANRALWDVLFRRVIFHHSPVE